MAAHEEDRVVLGRINDVHAGRVVEAGACSLVRREGNLDGVLWVHFILRGLAALNRCEVDEVPGILEDLPRMCGLGHVVAGLLSCIAELGNAGQYHEDFLHEVLLSSKSTLRLGEIQAHPGVLAPN